MLGCHLPHGECQRMQRCQTGASVDTHIVNQFALVSKLVQLAEKIRARRNVRPSGHRILGKDDTHKVVEACPMGLSLGYIVRRIIMFFIVIWVAATLNFVIPRLVPGDPIQTMLAQMAQTERVENAAAIAQELRTTYGLDAPLQEQYARYLLNSFRFDFGLSLNQFPTKVNDLILRALPWTIGLLATTTLLSFGLGTLMGALLVWRGTPRWAQAAMTPFTFFAAVPYFLLAVIFLYVFAYVWKIMPTGGVATAGATAEWSPSYVWDVLQHFILPAAAMTLAGLGNWMLGIRGMMVTMMGADYLNLARAKGLTDQRIFFRYALRNAMLPQVTSLVIALGHIVSGAILIEVIFTLPGIGYLLYRSIGFLDYPMIQGITFVLVVSVAFSVLLLDLLYPKLDPRITYSRR